MPNEDAPTVNPERGEPAPVHYRPKTMEGYIAPSVVTPRALAPVWKIQWDRITYLFDSTATAIASIQATYPSATVTESPNSTDTIKVYDVTQGRRLQDRVTVIQHDVNNVAVTLPGHGTDQSQEF